MLEIHKHRCKTDGHLENIWKINKHRGKTDEDVET